MRFSRKSIAWSARPWALARALRFMLAGVLGTAFLAACASTGQRVVVPWRAGNATSLQMGTVEEHRAQAAHGVLPITLYRPTGAGPFPFVVLLHGCGGLKHDAIWTQWVQPWAALFHDYGIGTAVVDSFGPRGVAHVCTGDVAAWAVRRADVAYSSRVWLAEHPDVDAVFEGMWGRCPGCCKSVAEQKHRANGFQHRLVQGLRASLTPVSSTRAVEGFFLCPESRTGALTSTLCGFTPHFGDSLKRKRYPAHARHTGEDKCCPHMKASHA